MKESVKEVNIRKRLHNLRIKNEWKIRNRVYELHQPCMKRALEVKKVVENVKHVKHKRLDLRNNSIFKSFNCQKFEFAIVHNKKDITTHSTDTPQEEKHKHQKVRELLHAGLEVMYERGISNYAVIHFYIHCEEMDKYLIFSGAGKERRKLKQLRCGKNLDPITDKFDQRIHSGRNVTLDDNTRVKYYAFIPSVIYR